TARCRGTRTGRRPPISRSSRATAGSAAGGWRASRQALDEDRVAQEPAGAAHVEPVERRRAVEGVAVPGPERRRARPRSHDGAIAHERYAHLARLGPGRLDG